MSVRDFESITGFLVHIAEAGIAVHVAAHRALDRAANVIERDAKRQIGHYQEEAGPFNAWPQLAESTMQDRVQKGFSADDPLLRTGELRDSISREVDGLEAVVGSTSDIMVYQELGTEKIPPRPVMGPAAFKNKDKIEQILGDAVVHALEYGAASSFIALPSE